MTKGPPTDVSWPWLIFGLIMLCLVGMKMVVWYPIDRLKRQKPS